MPIYLVVSSVRLSSWGDGYWECKSIPVSVFSIVKYISVNGQWLRDGKKTIYEMSSNFQIPRYILTPAVVDSYL